MARPRNNSRSHLEALADQIARENGIPPALFKALVTQESGWDPTAGSSAGARGLTQLMPGTARGLGVRDVEDPVQSLRGGARYLRQMLDKFHTPELALSAYNSGPGGAESHGQIEPFAETQAYVQKVMALESQYGGGGAPAGMPPAPASQASPEPMQSGPPGPGASFGDQLAADRGPGVPTFGDLISKVGSESSDAVGQVIGQAQEAAGTDASQGGPDAGAQPTFSPGDAGPDVQTDGGSPAVGGLNAEFARRFALLQKAIKAQGGDLFIYSGARDAQKQAQLYQAALKKYGSEQEARKWVAPPGKSNHDDHAGMKYGLGDGAVASDLRGDIAMAHKLAARFGLVFPLSNEAWHIELAGIRNMK